MLHVIAYDVVDDSRRSRVARHLEGFGRRVEKSVFECDVSAEEIRQVLSGLKDLLDMNEDRCHCYRVCADCAAHMNLFGADIEAAWKDAVIV